MTSFLALEKLVSGPLHLAQFLWHQLSAEPMFLAWLLPYPTLLSSLPPGEASLITDAFKSSSQALLLGNYPKISMKYYF